MAQSGFTPIQLYYSTTASNVPSASNLALGELAINIADGKLYYNSSGTVKLIAANLLPIANGGTFSTSIPTAGAISYGNGSSYQFTAVGTTGQLLTSAGAGVPTWSNIADIAVTSLSFGTTGFIPSTATKGDITVAGTLAVANGGTGLASTPANGALDIGNGTGFTRATLTAGTGATITNAAGSITISATGTGGTVTSVGLSLPSIFTVTGSPVTTSGTLTATLATETANYVFAGPTTGAAAIPTFRALVAADVPGSALTKTDDTNVTLTLGGSPTTALLNAASLTLGWSGQLAVGRGGTGLSAGTSGGIPYFSSTSAMTSSALLTQYGVIYGGGAGASPVATAAGTTGQILTATTGGAPTWSSTYAGTVTSVSFTGGIITVATASTTPALTVAGTSGGIPYFSSATTWATSAALTLNSLVLGGGAGAAPATTATGTGVVTALGVNTGTAGAFVVNGGNLGTPSSGTVTNLTGTASININGTVGATTPAAGTFTSLSDSGNLTFTGTGNRITGDMSNATVASRIMFQTTTANTGSQVGILPNGTALGTFFNAYANSDPTNTSYAQFGTTAGTEVRVASNITGTGTYLPMTFYTGGSERMRIVGGTGSDVGNVGIGTSSPAVKLDVLGTIQVAAAATQDAVRLAGRAGGTGTYAVTLTPTTLTASQTLTLPDATTTIVGTDATQTLTNKTISSGTLTGTLTAGGGVGTSGQVLQSTATGVKWAAATGVLAKQTDVFTSATAATYTAPANTQWVKITVVGSGGNGGGILSQRGSGGGGGGVAIKWLAITAGQTLIYTVGLAVTSTVVSGTLTITTITAGSGNVGLSTAYAAGPQGGGAGGFASGGDININGGTGGTSYGSSTAVATQVSGVGGNCPGFGSGGTNTAAAISNGNNGNGYGAGGSGSIGNTSVGLGTSGVIIFEAF